MINDNRYMLFTGDDYYPIGGIDDMVGCGASVDEILSLIMATYEVISIPDGYQIYDTHTSAIVSEGDFRKLYTKAAEA